MIDSLGRQTLGASGLADVVTNIGADQHDPASSTSGSHQRIEITDTIHVEARDRAGITWVGYEVRNLPSGTLVLLGRLDCGAGEHQLVHAHVQNESSGHDLPDLAAGPGVRSQREHPRLRTQAGGQQRRDPHDTVIVVAGLTTPLAAVDVVADAIYHPTTNRIYLTNIERNELDVFNLGDSTFHTPIQVGSRPWGLAAWPRDRDGTMGDTLLVANSGGTLISYVDTNTAARKCSAIRCRYSRANGHVDDGLQRCCSPRRSPTTYFSDRPQYLGRDVPGAVSPRLACGNVVLVYTTTPTAGQSVPFANARYGAVGESARRSQSHFFFEQAMGQSASTKDTLADPALRRAGRRLDATLVPFRAGARSSPAPTRRSTRSWCKIPALGFRDTTFARNSGNFRRAVFGEGGAAGGTGSQPNSRAMTVRRDTGAHRPRSRDKGHTYRLSVRATSTRASPARPRHRLHREHLDPVSGVAINFDGELTGVRADSTYLFDNTLRLQGMLQTSARQRGYRLPPAERRHPCARADRRNTPLLRGVEPAAGRGLQHELLHSLPRRPDARSRSSVRSSRRPIGAGQLVLVGATAHGVVIVTVTAAQLAACT